MPTSSARRRRSAGEMASSSRAAMRFCIARLQSFLKPRRWAFMPVLHLFGWVFGQLEKLRVEAEGRRVRSGRADRRCEPLTAFPVVAAGNAAGPRLVPRHAAVDAHGAGGVDPNCAHDAIHEI